MPASTTKAIIKTITPDEVCQRLRTLGIRTSATRIRAGIKSGAYPFGVAFELGGERTEYEVYEKLFDKWVNERIEYG